MSLSQEVGENDLQTDPRRVTSTQPHLSTPIITLSPHTVMNSLPIPLYSHTLCSGTSLPPRPLILRTLGAQILARNSFPTAFAGRHALRDSQPLCCGVTTRCIIAPLSYRYIMVPSYFGIPSTNMSASDEEARPIAGIPSPATNAQDRVRLTITTIHAGHRSSGSDDNPSANEGRGTPHEPTEGLDQDTCWSDHSNHYHSLSAAEGTLGRGTRRVATSIDYGGPVARRRRGQKTVRRSRRAGRDEGGSRTLRRSAGGCTTRS